MSLKDHLPKGVVEALYEPDVPAPPEAPKQSVAPIPQWAPGNSTVRQPSPYILPPLMGGAASASVLSSAVTSILADLRVKTNFDATPIGQQLKGSMDALADTGLSDEQKSKTALKLSHQSPAQVVSVLQGLQAVLVSDKQHFEATMQTATTAEVSARQTQSAQLESQIEAAESQINAMRSQKSQIDAEIQEKQQKIASVRANYAAASEARTTELAEMISHYQSIPEVN